MMRERIALMIESDGPGGAETVFVTLAMEYRKLGHDVFPVVHRNGPGTVSDALSAAGFSVNRPSLRRPLDIRAVSELASWLEANAITAVHAHEFTSSVYGSAAARWYGVRCMMTMHGGMRYAKAMRRRVALALAARSCDHVIGVSNDTARALESSLWLPQGFAKVVPNGVIARRGDRERGRKALGLGADEKFLLSVGNLYPVKGHAVLVEAAALLRVSAGFPDWKIGIAGRGNERESLLQLINERGLDDRVVLLGLRDDVPDLLAAADLFVMPSLSEGMPMAILEAMYAGLPLICSAVGGIPELLEDGKLGVLVPAGDATALARAMDGFLGDPSDGFARAELAAIEVHRRYSAEAMARCYLSMLTGQSVTE